MDREKLNAILENHKKWIMGNGGEKANLSNANLRWADLNGADLSGAYLSGADLRWADLRWADLSGADLNGANLRWADLNGANLRWANLSEANLSEANLSEANLSEADLRWADIRMANLRWVDLSDAKGVYYPLRCPDTGSFVGWKKAGRKIVKILITNDAKRSSSTGNKCRCNKAFVLEIQSVDGKETFRSVASDFDESFLYEVGKTVKVDNFDENRWEECAPGIHFFITREEAVNYV